MIIDDVKITVTGGNGGNGIVRFNKTKMSLGPTGGSGGKGGDVYLKGVSDLSALKQFRFKKDNPAKNGDHGKFQNNDGKDAEDLVLSVPVGTIAHNLTKSKTIEITKIGQIELIAKGGRGGKGNFLYRSAINTTPLQSEKGKSGEHFEMHLELKMIADVGFIGLPNVGKSSLLNELTNASAKVANYPFTTLEPNLGVYFELILADIPGLIEGASVGKGLGIKFLKHVERTKVLFHLVSAESENPVQDYKTVRTELEIYPVKSAESGVSQDAKQFNGASNPSLSEKPEYIFISKIDSVPKETVEKIQKDFEKIGKSATPISIIDSDSLGGVKKILNNLISEKTAAVQSVDI